MVLGVTGRYCAGKDTAVDCLMRRGFVQIDVDRIGHQVLQRERERVAERFGSEVLAADGGIDRRALARIVFSSPDLLRDLERIVHPPMIGEVERRVRMSGDRVVINAALLHRMGLHRLCDAVICVTAPLMLRLVRAMRRDRGGLIATLRRMAAQPDVCPKKTRGAVDTYIVRNAGSRDALMARTGEIVAAVGECRSGNQGVV